MPSEKVKKEASCKFSGGNGNNNDGKPAGEVDPPAENGEDIGNFRKGKINGTFTAILMGGGDSTSLECTLDVDGLGLFTKPQKLLDERLEMLRKALGV